MQHKRYRLGKPRRKQDSHTDTHCTCNTYTIITPKVLTSQMETRKTIHQGRRLASDAEANSLLDEVSGYVHHTVLLSQEKGASSWLSSLPIQEHGFTPHRGAFHDALAVHYSWTPKEIPVECTCGKRFTIEHALSCARGIFSTLRHNEIRDLTTSMLSEVYTNVSVQPSLQELSGKTLSGRPFNGYSDVWADIQ